LGVQNGLGQKPMNDVKDELNILANEVLGFMEKGDYPEALNLLRGKQILLNHFNPQTGVEIYDYEFICDSEMKMAFTQGHHKHLISVFEVRIDTLKRIQDEGKSSIGEIGYMGMLHAFALALAVGDSPEKGIPYLKEYADWDPHDENIQKVLSKVEKPKSKRNPLNEFLLVIVLATAVSLLLRWGDVDEEYALWINVVGLIFTLIYGYRYYRHLHK